MLPTRLRFTGRSGEYALTLSACPMLDCTCTEISLSLREVGRDRAPYLVRVDVPTWREVDAPERPADLGEMVNELLRDFPESERAALRKMLADKRTILQHLKTCRLPPGVGEDAELAYFDEVVAAAGEFIVDGPLKISWPFEWRDREFLVQDSYCVNPDCDCRDVHLHLYDVTPPAPEKSQDHVVKQIAQATISLDGELAIQEMDGCDAKEVRTLLFVWRERHPFALDQLRWRYSMMKEIGRRSGRKGRPAAIVSERRTMPLLAPAEPVGRNDPCPCGSGVKYKKCCGR